MSLIEHFLPRHLQTPSNIKYFHSLLSLPLTKLEKEKDSLQSKIEVLESQIRSHAVQESKDFVQALSRNSSLIDLSSSLNTLLQSCAQATLSFKSQVLIQSTVIDNILLEQQKLENLSNLQSVINEVMEIPQLLKNLLNSKHYKEALDLLLFAENLKAEGPAFEEIRQVAQEARKRMNKELLGVVHESFEREKLKETFKLIEVLQPNVQNGQVFIQCKKEYFDEMVKRQVGNKVSFLDVVCSVGSFLERFGKVSSLFEDCDLVGFNIDILCTIFSVFSKYSAQTLAELSAVAHKFQEINENFFIPTNCDIWPETYKLLEQQICIILKKYRKKTLFNFESLFKVYVWQVSPNQTSPLLEFGSIAVLYNNCLTIINEVRQIPLLSCKALFFEELSLIFKGALLIVKEKTKSYQNRSLNKQEEIMKDLMNRYIDCLTAKAFAALQTFALETFPDSKDYAQMLVIPTQQDSAFLSLD